MIKQQFKRLGFAANGIWYALKTDFSYRWQFIAGGLAVFCFANVYWPLSNTELLFLGLAWSLILITELLNTAFETVLDHLHPDDHAAVGHSKDMAAGAVLTAGLFFVFVILVIIFT